ncbi:murein biosynthesis integral membrane protein MurJ [Cohnella mopanensis]|uniref:murein biosynthesis integral membrane protein MurJ n=1 Tax=Cohnella mopanensis TaxID=2911966 RepID=UPI001EF7C123|nr:lipid II flippase MurJ [Cohnella mopanensis]
MLRKIIKAGIIVSLGIMLGRIAGFFREAVIASKFGATSDSDIAITILTLPDLFLTILIGGVVSAVFIPEFKKLNPADGRRLFFEGMLLTLASFGLISILLGLFSQEIVSLISPGFSQETLAESGGYLQIVFWSIPITAATAMVTSYLQSDERFLVPALGTFIFNAILILALVLSPHSHALLYLSWAILLASMVRLVSQMLNVPRLPNRDFLNNNKKRIFNKEMLFRYFQVVSTSGFLFLIPVIARGFASFEGDGAVSILNFANKIIELPMGAVITVIPIVLLPKLAELSTGANQNQKELQSMVSVSAGLTFVIATTISIYFAWFSPQIVKITFGWGNLSSESVKEISRLLLLGVLALPAMGLSNLVQMIFNAKGDTKVPFVISLISVVLFIPLCLLFVDYFEIKGLMLSNIIIFWLLFGTQSIFLYRRHKINLFKVLISADIIRMICVLGLSSAIVMIASFLLPSSIGVQIIVALLGGVLSLSLAFMAVEKYRSILLIKFKRRIDNNEINVNS